MKRIASILLILILFISFAIFSYCRKLTNLVMNIIDPSLIQIDLNNNGVIDDYETICIPDIESFSLNLKDNPPDFAENMNLSKKDIIALGYLADEYSKNVLFLKPVRVKLNGKKNADCRFGEIYIEGEKYSDKLIDAGFGARKGIYSAEKFKEKLVQAQKLKLVILNHKSYKYHKLDCEYGLISSDYTIIPEKQLPKEAKPCKFCHLQKSDKKNIEVQNLPKPGTIKSEGDIKLILTDLTTKLKPDRNCDNEVCLTVLREINSAKSSIDIAVYGWDNIPKVYDALLNAKSRGVKIRVVYDKASDAEKQYYKETETLVKIADVSNSDFVDGLPAHSNQLMHNKFMILDNKTVITGSMNFSYTGLSGFNSNAIAIINSKDVSKLYKAEFEQMLSGKFHNQKSKLNLTNSFELGKTHLEIYFSPYDKAMQAVIPIIDRAKSYIYIPTFLITHNDLTNALIRAKQRGVDIKIIIDANNTATRNSKHSLLRQNKIPLKTENYAGKMHSKSIIVDDKYVITGSMNFSNSGENKNDENMLIIENPQLAKFYREFFAYLWAKIPDKWLIRNARPESPDSIGSCYDGIDNDFDGLVDKMDDGCVGY